MSNLTSDQVLELTELSVKLFKTCQPDVEVSGGTLTVPYFYLRHDFKREVPLYIDASSLQAVILNHRLTIRFHHTSVSVSYPHQSWSPQRLSHSEEFGSSVPLAYYRAVLNCLILNAEAYNHHMEAIDG